MFFRLDQSIKENDFVYHDRIPDIAELPEIQGQCLPELITPGTMSRLHCLFCDVGTSIVKPIPFQPNDPSVSGADIFAKLVPMVAHEASSIYRFQSTCMPLEVSID